MKPLPSLSRRDGVRPVEGGSCERWLAIIDDRGGDGMESRENRRPVRSRWRIVVGLSIKMRMEKVADSD